MYRGRLTNRQRLSAGINRASPYYRQPDKPKPTSSSKRQHSLLHTTKIAVAWLLTRTGVLAVVAAFIFWGLTSSQSPKVSIGSGVQYRPESIYQAAAASKMHTIRDLSKFTFDTKGVEQYLESTFPEVVSANIELPLVGRQPIVRISIAKPSLYLISSSGVPEVVSSQGKIVGSAKSLHINTPMPRLTAGNLDLSGSQVLGTEQVTFIENIQDQLNYAKVPLDHFAISGTAQELDAYIKGIGYYVKFNFSGNGVGQAGSYLATAHFLSAHHIAPSKYVDVRVPGKVFYK